MSAPPASRCPRCGNGVAPGFEDKHNAVCRGPVAQQPGATTAQQSRFGQANMITQEMIAKELCGWEAKQKYSLTLSNPNATQVNGPQTMYIHEQSACCQRQCLGPCRQLELIVSQQHRNGPELYRMQKPQHCQGCCCDAFRPHLYISQQGQPIGEIFDPFHCCTMDSLVMDAQKNVKYHVMGPVCQCGMCCPCCGNVSFEIRDANGGPSGEVTKIFNGCSELCLGVNRFKVIYPPHAPEADKPLLLGAAMLLDLEYFERKK